MSERIRILQLVAGLSIGERNGGAEMFAVRLAGALDPRRFEVSVMSLWRHGGQMERLWQRELTERGIAVYFGGPYRDSIRIDTAMAFVSTYPLVRALRPHILHSHTEYADLVGIALRRATPTRVHLRTAHNVLEWTFAPPWARYTRHLYPLAIDYEATVSRAIAEQLDRRPVALRLGRRAHYIPNAVEPDIILSKRSGRDMRAELGIPPDAPLFGTVGRLSEQKGMPYLFDAMSEVRQRLPGARLVVAGHGELAEEYRQRIERDGQAKYIHLLGPRADAIDVIDGLDVFVSSSLWEGLPTVIMEAMVLGTPVVATDVSGSSDLVLDRRTGLIVPAADAMALAGAMVEQYRERGRAKQMAHAAREHVGEFTIPRVAAAYGELYEKLARRAKRYGGAQKD